MDFAATIDHLDEMMNYIRERAVALGATEKTVHKIELACEEALVNIVSYAYPKKKGNISIDCEMQGHRLLVVLCDQGRSFNPIDTEINPQLEIPVTEREVGGLGIYLLRKVIDEASYQREGGQNILRLSFGIE